MDEILNSNNKKTENPLLSICLLSYNQEKYIRQCVDSILQQKTSFEYELIIGDDCSTDNTAKILKKYYSDNEKIRLVLREKNLGTTCNSENLFQQAKGKYILCFEGDDYLFGEDGLQTLVDWLERHEKYAGVAGRNIVFSERTKRKTIAGNKNDYNYTITLKRYLNGQRYKRMTNTIFRNFFHDGRYDYSLSRYHHIIGDFTMVLYILLHGPVFQHEKIISVYRTDQGKGATSYNAVTSMRKMHSDRMLLIQNLDNMFPEKLDFSVWKKIFVKRYVDSLNGLSLMKEIPFLLKESKLKVVAKCLIERMLNK